MKQISNALHVETLINSFLFMQICNESNTVVKLYLNGESNTYTTIQSNHVILNITLVSDILFFAFSFYPAKTHRNYSEEQRLTTPTRRTFRLL